MLLLFDVGNSNISFAVYEEHTLKDRWRIKTDTNKTADEYSIILNNLISKYPIHGVVIASVVPIITNLLNTFSTKYLTINPLIIGPGVKTGLDIRLNNPKEIGSDLVASAVGAMIKYPQPCIIFDMGTATTITLLDHNTFHGGAVLPGIETSLFGLVKKTALLPHIDIKAPKRVIEKETVTSMQSGIVYGNASAIDGMIDRIEKEYNKKCFAVATGGLAKHIIPHCLHQIKIDRYLIYDGLIEIYNKNNEVK
ncbi:type III pantothenate kinase [Mycoplasmatota bacterium]|nr:type III pantothenate kinase [Mycoplasmatota bacterium]